VSAVIPAIPASKFVSSLPSVLTAAGSPASLNSVWLDTNTSIPIGSLVSFGNQAAVAAYFGASSTEASLATIYFNGFTGATQVPSALYFFQYNTTAVSGYMRSGSLAAMTLTQLQALSGAITVSIDGTSHTSASINLSAATSFTDAASLIQTGLQSGVPTTTATVTWDAQLSEFVITSSTTGATSSVGYGTDTSLSPSLKLTQTTGAVLSPGAAANTPSGAMDEIVGLSQNWGSFTTVQDPDSGAAGGPQKLLFSAWVSGQNGAYAYVPWDTDIGPTEAIDGTCFAALAAAADYTGVIPVWGVDATKAAFITGAIASINFTATNGRVDFAYLGQSGLTPDVTDITTYDNLVANNYNCYCAVATRTEYFQFLQPGSMIGAWKWIDPYVDQIYFNSEFQLDLLTLRTTIKFIPYTPYGYNLIRQAMGQTITDMGNFGAWVSGVTLSGSQIAAVNAQAGINISTTLQNQGWYLLISDPGATARASRLSPNISFYYTDGGNVNTIVVNSVDLA
jgi:hypothetical protein